MAKINKIPLIYTSVLYLCGFFLFLEWLYPLGEFTDINNLAIFIIYAVFCFLISVFNMRWWISLVVKGIGLLFIIDSLFTNDPLWGEFSFQALYLELSINIKMLFLGNWYNITDVFRSILFLLLIWMISYLIYYWFIVMKRIFLFVLLTFIYITLLDTFTFYDASFAIVRGFIISFIALGMANFFREIDRQQVELPWMKHTKQWMIPIICVVFLTTLIGYSAPKYEPQWPDPVPFLQAAVDSSNGSGLSFGSNKSGYGNDDSQLGGSFLQDDATAFHAITKHREYWRIETKDVYTGKGWESTTTGNYDELGHGLGSLATYSQKVVTEDNEALIEFKDRTSIDKLVYPYGLKHVEVLEGPDLLMDTMTGAIQKQATQLGQEEYKIDYQKPQFDLDVLRSVNSEAPSVIQDQYTKVPEALPERIGDLAQEITASTTNRFEQAQAIERYFGRSGFVYETDDVPYPAEDQDYVDQFLFETQAGYCDNYSTAMVVMLRTLDIPARWVKGFTGGERIANTLVEDELFDIYEVTNANAHSWVEVYFSDVGWVPFEPTQGFTNPTDFVQTSEEVEDQVENDQVEEDLEVPEEESPEAEEKNQSEVAEDSAQDEVIESEINWLYMIIGIALFILVGGIIIYLTRFRWKPAFIYAALKSNHDYDSYEKAYHYLLVKLKHKGITKDPSQSLREYAADVDRKYETNEMGILTSYYEKLLYNKQIRINRDHEWIDMWKNFIKHIQKNPSKRGRKYEQ